MCTEEEGRYRTAPQPKEEQERRETQEMVRKAVENRGSPTSKKPNEGGVSVGWSDL